MAIIASSLVMSAWLLTTALGFYLGERTLGERGSFDTMISAGLGALVIFGGMLLNLRLARMRELAQWADAEQRQILLLARMSAVMAHELRNPLASAKGHSQLLAEMLDTGTRTQRKAQLVVAELERLEAVTDELMRIARSGRIRPRHFDPVELAHAAAERIEAEVELETRLAPRLALLDPIAMEQVLTNLLRNAVEAQAAASSTPILLRVEAGSKAVRFVVRDHGHGVDAELDIFTPFVTTKRCGMGVGLSLSRLIVQAHGGRLTLRNHPEGGAVAEITLPLGETDELGQSAPQDVKEAKAHLD